MTSAAGDPSTLSAFLDARLDAGEDGKTFLVGYLGSEARFAVAVGLRNDTEQVRFLQFARYLLHHRFSCDGHSLLMPAEVDGRALYVAEHRLAGGSRVGLLEPGRGWRESVLTPGLIGDLRRPGTTLPGLLRREFDRLFDAVCIKCSGLPDIETGI